MPLLEQQANAKIIDTGVVADDGKVFRAFAADGGDEILRNAAKSEPAHENRSAVSELGNGGVGGSDAFVHECPTEARTQFTPSQSHAERFGPTEAARLTVANPAGSHKVFSTDEKWC